MNSKITAFLLAAVAATVFAGALANGALAQGGEDAATAGQTAGFTDNFFLKDCDFSTTGSNRFFKLEPNYQLTFTGIEDDGTKIKLVDTVLEDIKWVNGIKTRVLEERETEDGKLVEISRNYMAFCEETSSVLYFGEDVDIYNEGGTKVISHEGEWLAGKDGARAGLFMPGIVLLGSKYMQEVAPGVAMDRAQIVSMDETVNTPAGKFDHVVKIKETTPLEPGVVEYKFFAAGVGLIQDGDLKLVKSGFIS